MPVYCKGRRSGVTPLSPKWACVVDFLIQDGVSRKLDERTTRYSCAHDQRTSRRERESASREIQSRVGGRRPKDSGSAGRSEQSERMADPLAQLR